MLKYAQAVILPFTMIAAIIGIYYAQTPPFTHLAAGAVVVAGIIGLLDALKTTKEKAYAEEMLRHLARSLPPSEYWRERTREIVRAIASTKGYALVKAYSTKSDFADPEADAIFVFKSTNPADSKLKGLFVMTPADYVELAALGQREMASRLRALLFGEREQELIKDDKSQEDFSSRFAKMAAALYSLARFGEGFPVRVTTPAGQNSLIVEVGDVTIALNQSELTELVKEPPIKRTLIVAKRIAEAEPQLNKYLSVDDKRPSR